MQRCSVRTDTGRWQGSAPAALASALCSPPSTPPACTRSLTSCCEVWQASEPTNGTLKSGIVRCPAPAVQLQRMQTGWGVLWIHRISPNVRTSNVLHESSAAYRRRRPPGCQREWRLGPPEMRCARWLHGKLLDRVLRIQSRVTSDCVRHQPAVKPVCGDEACAGSTTARDMRTSP